MGFPTLIWIVVESTLQSPDAAKLGQRTNKALMKRTNLITLFPEALP